MRCKDCGKKWKCQYDKQHLQKECKCGSKNIECYGFGVDIRHNKERKGYVRCMLTNKWVEREE